MILCRMRSSRSEEVKAASRLPHLFEDGADQVGQHPEEQHQYQQGRQDLLGPEQHDAVRVLGVEQPLYETEQPIHRKPV